MVKIRNEFFYYELMQNAQTFRIFLIYSFFWLCKSVKHYGYHHSVTPPANNIQSSRNSSVKLRMSDSPQETTSLPDDGKVRRKMAVGEGRSMMHWQRLKIPIQKMHAVTMEEVAKHNRDDDCWTVFRGMVYNTTAYFDYHPGGRSYMKMAAGKDGTQLFDKHHAWVNIDFIMSKCAIGPLAGADGQPLGLPEKEDDEDVDEELELAMRNAEANAATSKLEAAKLDEMD